MDNELDNLDRYINEAKSKLDNRCRLRSLNLQENIDYSDVRLRLENLDSSIKKNSAFVKKLKIYNESQSEQILDEIEKLNSTKFISEIATSLIEARLKLSDIPSVIEVCTRLNRLYKDFHLCLLSQYTKYLPTIKKRVNHVEHVNKTTTSQQPSPLSQYSLAQISLVISHPLKRLNANSQLNEIVPNNLSASKLRVDLRLFSELLLTGILPLRDSFQLLIGALCHLMVSEKNVYQNANTLLTLFKGCNDELLGLVPSRIQQLAQEYHREIPVGNYINEKRRCLILNYTREYYQILLRNLGESHKELRDLIVKQQKICRARGDIGKEARELIETKSLELQKLQNVIHQFSEVLNETPPNQIKIEDQFINELESLDDQLDPVKLTNQIENGSKSPNMRVNSVWDDDGTRSFYEDLIDLRELFPSLQVKSTTTLKVASNESINKLKSTVAQNEEIDPTDQQASSSKNCELGEEDDDSSSTRSKSSSSETEELNSRQTPPKRSIADRVQPDQYFNKLANCVNRDMIDNAAIDFMKFFNTKFGRKKLIKTLFNVQRTRLDLLPFYARLAATLNPFVPNIGSDLAGQLKSEFRYLFKKKDQINIESKVKNVRFIGEFVKFNLISRNDAIECLKMLLSDFTHHHIEMTCNILETCGRLLYRSSDTHHQLKLILEQIMRKKLLLSVDSKYVTMIENAYYFTNPPEAVRQIVHEPPINSYIRYLLYECLNRSTIDKVLKKLELLDWNDKQLSKFVINRMIEAYNVKYYNIRYFAALLAALNKKHPWISIAVIDGVVEDIQLMLEINETQFNQRRIPMMRYFGELFNYRLSDSSLVFKILYSHIFYGIVYPDPNQNLTQIPASSSDPPDNLFRIKLVCDLLDICGPYLNSSQEKKKLDCYLLFLQRYYWSKRYIFMRHPYCMVKNGNQFPASIEYLYNDTIFKLRPSFQVASSYSEAIENLKNFMSEL